MAIFLEIAAAELPASIKVSNSASPLSCQVLRPFCICDPPKGPARNISIEILQHVARLRPNVHASSLIRCCGNVDKRCKFAAQNKGGGFGPAPFLSRPPRFASGDPSLGQSMSPRRFACGTNHPIRLFQNVGIFWLFSRKKADHHKRRAK